MYLKSIALAVLFLQVINQAHSLKCYQCKGDLSSDCETNPDKKEFLIDFSVPGVSDDHLQCVTLYETKNNTKVVEKNCSEKKSSCDKLKKAVEAKENGTTVDECKLCYTDSCNVPAASPTTPAAPAPTTNKPEDTLKCYECSDDLGSECEKSSNQKKFEKVCSAAATTTATPTRDTLFGAVDRASSEYHCLAFEKVKDKNTRQVERKCAPKSLGCNDLMSKDEDGVTRCLQCNTDLCNSSSTIQAAIFSLVSCIFVIMFSSKQH